MHSISDFRVCVLFGARDIACFPYVAMAPMGKIALEPYPAVQGWIARFKALPGYLSMPGL